MAFCLVVLKPLGGEDKAIIKVFDNGLCQTLGTLSLSTRYILYQRHSLAVPCVYYRFPAHATINVPYHHCCCVTTVAGRFLESSEIKDACGQL
jgi:hypothetical protein